jgi:hypothetical protein
MKAGVDTREACLVRGKCYWRRVGKEKEREDMCLMTSASHARRCNFDGKQGMGSRLYAARRIWRYPGVDTTQLIIQRQGDREEGCTEIDGLSACRTLVDLKTC